MKPLGHKSYGHIPHLPGSRIGEGDHKCSDGQKRICCEKVRDKHDRIIVQEKSDGSNVSIAKINGVIVALIRAGYLAETSPYEQHHKFSEWVKANTKRFFECINNNCEYDRLIIITDEQSHDTIDAPKGRGYVVNVASCQNGIGYGQWVHINGWSESVIDYIIQLERAL